MVLWKWSLIHLCHLVSFDDKKTWSKFQPLGKIPGFLWLHKNWYKNCCLLKTVRLSLLLWFFLPSPFPFTFLSILLHFLDLLYCFHPKFWKIFLSFLFCECFSRFFANAFLAHLSCWWMSLLPFFIPNFPNETACKQYQTKLCRSIIHWLKEI